MALALTTADLFALLLILAGVGLLAGTVRALAERSRGRRHGRLVAVDRMDRSTPPLRSERYRLVGRPDEIRRLADGRWIPVEIKHRTSPMGGPPLSHRIQVLAYCLLAEETSGRSVPYGLLRYSDGGEFRVVWDDGARAELLGVRRAVELPYDGRARPSPARCLRCPWRAGCDVRAA